MRRFHVFAGTLAVLALSLMTATAVRADFDEGDTLGSTTDGYLDFFLLGDGRNVNVGAQGGGLEGSPTTKRIFVPAQPIGAPPLPSDGRLTGEVHGKAFVTAFADRNGDTFINGDDLNIAFDVSWQLIRGNHTGGANPIADPLTGSAYVLNPAVGPEGTVSPFGGGSVNFPPTAGGTGSVFSLAACDVTGLALSGSGERNICLDDELVDTGSFPAGYTGWIDYTFPISIPAFNDHTPGLEVDPTKGWVIAALLGSTAGGAVTYGKPAAYNAQLAVNESVADLFGANTLLNFPGEMANITRATLLTTIQIVVTPEPATLSLLGLGMFAALRRRK